MMFALQLTFVDGSTSVARVEPSDILGFERVYWPAEEEGGKPRRIKFRDAFKDTPSMEHMFWIAWHASQRGSATPMDLESWVATLADFPQDAEEDEAPLASAP